MEHREKTTSARKLPAQSTHRVVTCFSAVIVGLLFLALAVSSTPFLQDDAYISFRYVENYLSGEGLVFNHGERIEGYTNFLWIILLSLAVNLGFGLPEAARWLGILFSAGVVVTTVILARRALAGGPTLWVAIGSIAAGLWVAVNPAVRYWSVAGLETGLFVLLVALAVERLLAGSPLCWGIAALASLTRPEGAIVFAACYLWYLLREPSLAGRKWRLPLLYYVLPLIPFGVFKWIYFGSLFPNPFYAKTGFSPDYWQSGIEYLWLHLQHFGLWGVLLIFLIWGLFRSGWKSPHGFLGILWFLYSVYIIAIGGDVLRAHRFFVPIWPIFAVAVTGGIILIFRWFCRQVILFISVTLALMAIAGYQWYYPAKYFLKSRNLEIGLVEKMRTVAWFLKKTDNREFSIAASTIGRLGYDLMGHTLIDILGLTDSTVARHPETIPGMQTTWKERHFNAGYVLTRDPDYILFSTGSKPSAPAERALILHSKFRQNYFIALYPAKHLNRSFQVFKRIGEFTKPDSVWPHLQLADDLHDALNYKMAGDYRKSLATLSRLKRDGPGDFATADNHMAVAYLRLGQPGRAVAYADSALAVNPYSVFALSAKLAAYQALGDSLKMACVVDSIGRICPWMVAK